MRRVKRVTYSGTVCEQEVYMISGRASDVRRAAPRLRFHDEEERAEHREKMARKHHAQLFNANFSPSSLYSTLTFDDENEVHTFRDAKRLRDNYVRRLRYAYPDAVIFIYMGRGKNTARIHFHMVSEGLTEEAIVGQWKYGTIRRIEHLREHNHYNGVDHGTDYTGLANYLFDHWTPEQGGHRFKATRNARPPQKDEVKECKRLYSEDKPPRAPRGYTLVQTSSTRFGYIYYKFVKLPEKRRPGRPKQGT